MGYTGVMTEARRLELPFDPSAPGLARAFVRANVPDGADVDDLELIASELATNAVVHGAPPITLAIRTAEARGEPIRLEVTQGLTANRPGIRTDAARGRGGYGLRLIAGLADDWGTASTRDTLTTWASVSR